MRPEIRPAMGLSPNQLMGAGAALMVIGLAFGVVAASFGLSRSPASEAQPPITSLPTPALPEEENLVPADLVAAVNGDRVAPAVALPLPPEPSPDVRVAAKLPPGLPGRPNMAKPDTSRDPGPGGSSAVVAESSGPLPARTARERASAGASGRAANQAPVGSRIVDSSRRTAMVVTDRRAVPGGAGAAAEPRRAPQAQPRQVNARPVDTDVRSKIAREDGVRRPDMVRGGRDGARALIQPQMAAVPRQEQPQSSGGYRIARSGQLPGLVAGDVLVSRCGSTRPDSRSAIREALREAQQSGVPACLNVMQGGELVEGVPVRVPSDTPL